MNCGGAEFIYFLIKAGEEGEDDAKSAWPSDILGYTHNTIAANNATRTGNREQIVKGGASSD